MNIEDKCTIAGLIYHEFTTAVQRRETVAKERNDGSPDWKRFHNARFVAANEAVEKWGGLNERFTAEYREDILAAYGLDGR